MSTEQGNPPPPRTPIRAAGELPTTSDPFSIGSTLTSISSLSGTLGQNGSPSRSWPLRTNLKVDTTPAKNERRVDLDENTPRVVLQRRIDIGEASDLLKHLLSPQKALPAKMTLVSDSSPTRLHFPVANLATGQSSHPRVDSDASSSSSEQEIWVPDPALDLQWPEDELEEFMHCLKEEGLVKCYEEYVVEKGYSLRKMLGAFGKKVKDQNVSDDELEDRLLAVMRQALRNRERIGNYCTVNHAVQLLRSAKNIMIITGAGISVSCGIKDFRSRDGIYATIKQSGKYDDLDDPQQMFSLKEFMRRPSMFYSFIGQLWPQEVKPSITHEFIKLLETDGKLLRNYTQNIDSLEVAAGVERVFHCHGSFKSATCLDCGREAPGSEIMGDVLSCKVPQCAPCLQKEAAKPKTRPKPQAKPKKKKSKRPSKAWDDDDSDDSPHEKLEKIVGVMKPSITFFGEKLHSTFDDQVYLDRDQVDLLLIIGSSMKVKPVSEISAHIPHSIPQILINREPVPHANVDIALLGDCDRIIEYLCHEAGWVLPSQQSTPRQARRKWKAEEEVPASFPQQQGNSHVWAFEGADKSKAKAYGQKHDPSFKVPIKPGKLNTSRSDPSLRETKRRRLS